MSVPTFKDRISGWLWVILLLEYGFIFFFLLNYYFAFMHHETVDIHKWVLSNGKAWHWEDFSRALNIDVLEENADRLSRPISNFVEVVDTKFRAFCWNFLPPHPSLSCLWPLLFIGLPFFLFKFFKNMGCYAAVALGGTCLYLGSIGFLGPLVMMFRPSKSLVNFFAVVSLYLGSRIYKQMAHLDWNCSIKEIPHFWREYLLFLSAVFLAFFCDETGVFVFIMAAVILHPVFLKFKERAAVLASFLSLPALYLGFIYVILPYIHLWVRGHAVHLGVYEDMPHLANLSLKGIAGNFWWLLSDHPHVQLNTVNLWPYNHLLFILQLIYSLSLGLILWLFVSGLCREGARLRMMQIKTSGMLLLLFVLFQSLLLSGFRYKSWGVWWYGSLFSLLYFLLFTFILQFIMENKAGAFFSKIFAWVILIGVAQGLAFGVYRVDLIEGDQADYSTLKANDGGYSIDDIFNGRIGPYYKSLNWMDIAQKSACRRFVTFSIWNEAKHKGHQFTQAQKDYCDQKLADDYSFTAETGYLSVEL